MRGDTPGAAHFDNPDAFDPFAFGPVEQVVASTEAQREVWLADQFSPEAALAYNEASALRLVGRLDEDAIARSIERLIERHQSLRSSFSADGTQLLIGAPPSIDLVCHDLSRLDAAEQARRLEQACARSVGERFELAQGPLFRADLYRAGPEDHTLLLSAHHAVCDGWSWHVLHDELSRLYTHELGLGPPLEPAPHFVDYARWEAEEAAGPTMRPHVDYWLSRFSGTGMPVLELPTDRPRPPVRSFRSRRVDVSLDKAVIPALRKVAAGSGASLYAVLLSAFAGLLHRITAQEDLVVGISSAGQLASDMPRLVGHCVNLLPLRMAVHSSMPLDLLVRESAGLVLDAFEHQALSYGALLKKLVVSRDASRVPLVSVLFNVDADIDRAAAEIPGLAVHSHSIPREYENFELFLNLTPKGDGLLMEMQYNADLFDEATVRRWLGMYECLLTAAARDPAVTLGGVDLLSPAEAARLAALQPVPTPVLGKGLMHQGFLARVASAPERVALRHGTRQWTYREIDERSNRLAHRLRELGVGRGDRVGLCLGRNSDHMLVALLAILKSGGAYVPLDPSFPKARLDYYAQDAQLRLLVTASDIAHAPTRWRETPAPLVLAMDTDEDWLRAPSAPLPPGPQDPQPGDVAYLIYTSGSTGQPKGVCVPHAAVANLLQYLQKELGIGADDRMAATTTLSFDISVVEMMLPLAVGAEICLVTRETAMDGAALKSLLEQEQVTLLQATPGAWRLLVDAGWQGRAGFKALVGGETLSRELALALLSRCGTVWNMYGPTETTVYSSVWRIDATRIEGGGVPIGKAIDNTIIAVLDAECRRCPVGVPGEICIGGAGVSLGYLNSPELTAQRFLQLPESGHEGLFYRTGDRGRWRNDGLLEHLGRFDHQVKVRGFRIELGEIEARCTELSSVGSSVVATREDRPGDVRIVAYLVASPGAQIDTPAVDRALRVHLPQYMLPQHLVVLDAIPRLPNGKVDRSALPAPVAALSTDSGRAGAPRNDRERCVLVAMEQALSLPGLGIRDDFFALGGHSLLAARLAMSLGREFGVRVPLRAVFIAPTAERLAGEIGQLLESGHAPSAPIPSRPGRSSGPLTPMQERMHFLEELHPGRPIFNTPSAYRLTGALDIAAFEAALCEIVRRQPALRTFFGSDPVTRSPVASIAAEMDFAVPLIDLGGWPADQREAELVERMQELADKPVDIHAAPLFNAALFRMDAQDHAFAFVPHHLVWDGWSADLFARELCAIYGARLRGVPHALPELAVTHADYAEWYLGWQKSPEFEAQLGFWKKRFANAAPAKTPRTDIPRRAGMTGDGGTHWIDIDAALTERLRSVARSHGLTLNMLTLGVYVLTMSSAMGARALVVATPVRGRELPELEPVMGFFNNLLAVSFEVDPSSSIGDFLHYVKDELVAVMHHQLVPFERLAIEPELSGREKGLGIYQTLFSFEDGRGRPKAMGDLQVRETRLSQRGASEDIGVWLLETADGIEGRLTYNADIYRRETGAAMRNRYMALLARVADRQDGTVAELTAPGDSRDAALLQRLSGSAPNPVPTEPSPVALRPSDARSSPPAPLLPHQLVLAQIWSSVLKIDVRDIRPHDNFFDLGGDSLLAMRVMPQAEQALGLRVSPARYVFETLSQLASADAAQLTVRAESQEDIDIPGDGAAGRGLLGRLFGLGRKAGQR